MREFQSRPVVVEAVRFERMMATGNPPRPFEIDECACDGMDAYTCGRHRHPPEYGYHIGFWNTRRSIRVGQWAIRLPDNRWEVLSDAEFHAKYEPRGGSGQEP